MKLKYGFYFLLIAALIGGLNSVLAEVNERLRPTETYDNATQLRNFALAGCLMHAFSEEQAVHDDASATLGGYIELGSYVKDPDDDYLKIYALIKQWLQVPYVSQFGGSLHIMQCIDLFHSDELKTLVEEIDDRALNPDR